MRLFRCLVPVITSALCLLPPAVSGHRDRINHLSLIQDPVIHSPSHRVHSSSHFDITFQLHQTEQRIKLTLAPNHDILADDAQVVFLNSDGEVQRTESIQRHDHRVFKGHALLQLPDGGWERVGWARITVQEDGLNPLFEGAFSIRNDDHNLMLRSKYMRVKHQLDPHLADTTEDYMVVFRDSDVGDDVSNPKRALSTGESCGTRNLDFNDPIFRRRVEPETSSWGSISVDSIFGLSKRQNDVGGDGRIGSMDLVSTIGSTAGCPSTRKVALIGVATDCEYFKLFDTKEATRANVISVVNGASEIFESSFNITLGLRNLTVLEGDCPSTPRSQTPWNVPCGSEQNPTIDIDERLNLFSGWRSEQGGDNAFWTLMTSCRSGSEVGLAWPAQLCLGEVSSEYDPNDPSSQAVSGANVVVYTASSERQIFAHEAGHIFGAVHDCDDQQCQSRESSTQCCPFSEDSCSADGRFIMNPSAGEDMTGFSPCTVGNICSAMGRSIVQTSCLSNNRDVVTVTGGQCGNGIVEEGEECDCGGEQSCGDNQCCDAKTCKFVNGAVCDDWNEECCADCQFASSDTVCRGSNGQCDPEESCTGDSSGCPKDEHFDDGTECGDGLTCASGQCTSRNEQCRTLMGSTLGSNNTYACNEDTCSLSCTTPEMPSNYCSGLMQNFLDGTPCTAGGKCYNGDCQGSSFGEEAKQWIERNKPLVIGLSSGIGGVLILSILACIVHRYRSKGERKTMAPLPNMTPAPAPNMYRGPYPPSPAAGRWPSQRGGQPLPWQGVNSPPARPSYNNNVAPPPYRYA